MATIWVTGAGGFIGRALLQRLLAHGWLGQPVQRIVAIDVQPPDGSDPRLLPVAGALPDPHVLDAAGQYPPDAVFHLASLPGGAAEANPRQSWRSNVVAVAALLECLEQKGRRPRFVFASTVAVYGDLHLEVVDETTPVAPVMTYGAHKLAAEILLADATRRGAVDGLSLRLPGVVARPAAAGGLMSSFMSELFWAMRDRRELTVPVRPDGQAWWLSRAAAVDNLIQASGVDLQAWAPRYVVQCPALTLRIEQVVAALRAQFGEPSPGLLRYEPRPDIERRFAAYPPLSTPRARAAGFSDDGDARTLVQRALQGLSDARA